MNRIVIAAISPFLLCFFSVVHAQVTPQSVQIIHATYGAGDVQMDVTQKVQAAVAGGQNIRASGSFFGSDPAFGKVKTLAVTFVQGAVQYQTTAREGEQLSFAKANVDQSNVAPQNPPALALPEHPKPAAPTEAQTLSPRTAMWLIERIAIRTNAGITGIPPGTQVTLVEDHGEKLLVSNGNQTFEATRAQIATDVAVAQSARASDYAAQSSVAKNIATSISQHQQAVATANAQLEAAAKEKARAKERAIAAKKAKEAEEAQREADRPAPVASSLGRIGGGGGVYTPSSARFKQNIEPMNNASEAILALKPVTFRYKQELDPLCIPQFGLVAEEVEKVNPDLVTREADGKLYGVRYDAVNAMLLNEFLKEHHTVQELKSTVVRQEATITRQQREFEATTAQQRKEFDSKLALQQEQIQALAAGLQKVSAQTDVSKRSPAKGPPVSQR